MPNAPSIVAAVRDQVVQRGADPDVPRRGEPRQHEPGVADARVGEHPLDVGLRDREDAAGHDREDRERDHDRAPVPSERLQRHVEHAHQRRERRDLRPRRHERGHGGRRALVHVGRPHVERDRRDLEREPDREEPHGAQRRAPPPPCRRRSRREIADRCVSPVAPYASAMPNRKNAEENAPSRKYFIAASTAPRRVENPVRT